MHTPSLRAGLGTASASPGSLSAQSGQIGPNKGGRRRDDGRVRVQRGPRHSPRAGPAVASSSRCRSASLAVTTLPQGRRPELYTLARTGGQHQQRLEPDGRNERTPGRTLSSSSANRPPLNNKLTALQWRNPLTKGLRRASRALELGESPGVLVLGVPARKRGVGSR